MHSTFRSVLAVAALVSTVVPAHGAGKTTIDPNTVPKPVVAAPVEIKDPRLDQKIEYDAGNVRLHEVISHLMKVSGVTIYCGNDNSDWRVRDIPVTVAARDLPLGELLKHLTRCTHTSLRTTMTDKGIVYRVIPDTALQKALADYRKALDAHENAVAAWSWDVTTMLKDIPPSELKPPVGWFGHAEDSVDRLARQIEVSKLLAAMDADTKQAVLAGERIDLSPSTAPAGLRELVLGVLKAADKAVVNGRAAADGRDGASSNGTEYLSSATSADLERSTVRFRLSDQTIRVTTLVAADHTKWRRDTRVSEDNTQSIASNLQMSQMKSGKLPKSPEPPTPPQIAQLSESTVSLDSPKAPSNVTMIFVDTSEPKWFSDALIVLSKASGLSVVCEDFHSHRKEHDLRSVEIRERHIHDALYLMRAPVLWRLDTEANVLVGTDDDWFTRHENLIPGQLVDDLTAKANGDGIELDDLVPLAAFSTNALTEWLRPHTFLNLRVFEFSGELCTPFWTLYNSLSADNRARVRSKSGLPIGALEIAPILQDLADRAADGEMSPYGEKCSEERLLDPAVIPTLLMRIESREGLAHPMTRNTLKPDPNYTPKGPIRIPAGFPKRYLYAGYVEGTSGGEKVSAFFIGPSDLPFLSPEREKELSEAWKRLQKNP